MSIGPIVDRDCDDPMKSGPAPAAPRLRVVAGATAENAAAPAPPPVRLRREFKGLTVSCLQREEVARHLPGQVRSALACIERGDFAGAERALPGQLADVLAGPGHRRRGAGRAGNLLVLFAAAVGLGLASWMLA